MKNNISTTDRIVRLLLAATVAVLYFTHQIEGTAAIVLSIVGVIVAATAVFNFCPIYHWPGISTVKKSKQA